MKLIAKRPALWAGYRALIAFVSYITGYVVAFLLMVLTGNSGLAYAVGTVLAFVLGLTVDYLVFCRVVDHLNSGPTYLRLPEPAVDDSDAAAVEPDVETLTQPLGKARPIGVV